MACCATHYRWIDGERTTDVSVTAFVSESSPHLGVVSLELIPRLQRPGPAAIHLAITATPKRVPLARMTAEQFSALSAATHQENLATAANRTPSGIRPCRGDGFGRRHRRGHSVHDGRGRSRRVVALAAAIALPADLRDMHKTVQTAGGTTGLDIDVPYRAAIAFDSPIRGCLQRGLGRPARRGSRGRARRAATGLEFTARGFT